MTQEQGKELIRKIFGEETANDTDIVDFYIRVNKDAMQEYADEFACAFAEWKDKNNYKYFESLNGFIFLNIPNEKILTGIKLLQIFKKEQDGL